MPLNNSNKPIPSIADMVKAGHPVSQAIAAALRQKDQAAGKLPHFDEGGVIEQPGDAIDYDRLAAQLVAEKAAEAQPTPAAPLEQDLSPGNVVANALPGLGVSADAVPSSVTLDSLPGQAPAAQTAQAVPSTVTLGALPTSPALAKAAGPAAASSDDDSDDDDSKDTAARAPASDDSSGDATSSAPVNPLVAKYLADRDAMKQAQDQAAKNEAAAAMIRAGGLFATSAHGATKALDEPTFKALEADADRPVRAQQAVQDAGTKAIQEQQDLIKAQSAQEANDPKSSLTQSVRKLYGPVLLKNGVSQDALDSMGASDIKSYGQSLLEHLDRDRATEAAKQQALELQRERLENTRNSKENQAYNQVATQLEQMRGNPAVQQAEKDIYASSKANRLISQAPGGDPNNLSSAQVALLANDVAKVNSGGSPTQHELDALTPNALSGRLSKVYGDLVNRPTPANAGAFLKQYQDYANGVTQDAQKVITDRYGRIINTHADSLTDDQQKRLKDNYINRFNDALPAPAASQGAQVAKPNVQQNGYEYQWDPAQNKYVAIRKL